MAPTVTIASGVSSTIAHGAVRRRIASARTEELELEPRPAVMSRTCADRRAPICGCERSMILPEVASKPPQKLNGCDRAKTGPDASPRTRDVAGSIMVQLVRPDRLARKQCSRP